MTTLCWLRESAKASFFVLMLAVAIAYIERSAVSHALPFIIDEAGISKEQSGWVLSSFGFGYVLSLPMSGWILRNIGYGRTLRWLSIGWLSSAIAFSLAIRYEWMILARFFLGLSEGPLFPLFVSWISLETKAESRPLKIGIVEACSYVGMAVAGPITVSIAQSTNWRASYAIVGGLAAFTWLASYLLSEPRCLSKQKNADFPQLREARSFELSSVALVATGFLLYNIAKSFYSTWFPTLLVKGFGLTSMAAARVTFFQSLAAPVASLLLASAAIFFTRRGCSLLFSRCLPLTFGLTFGALIAAANWLPESITAISILAFLGLISTSALIWNAVPDNVDSRNVGIVAGWVNSISNIGSILSPLVVGYLIQNSRDLVLAFVSLACLLAVPNFLFAYFLRHKASFLA